MRGFRVGDLIAMPHPEPWLAEVVQTYEEVYDTDGDLISVTLEVKKPSGEHHTLWALDSEAVARLKGLTLAAKGER